MKVNVFFRNVLRTFQTPPFLVNEERVVTRALFVTIFIIEELYSASRKLCFFQAAKYASAHPGLRDKGCSFQARITSF